MLLIKGYNPTLIPFDILHDGEKWPRFGELIRPIFPKIRLIVHLTDLPGTRYNSVSSENSGKTKGNEMSNSTFQIIGKPLGIGSEAELIAKGLGYEEARAKAQAALLEFCSRFACRFEVLAINNQFEAVKRVDDRYSWGYQITIEPEPVPERESRFSLLDVRKAFDMLREVIRLEGDDPEANGFRLSSVEVDLERILSGKIRIENGRLVIV